MALFGGMGILATLAAGIAVLSKIWAVVLNLSNSVLRVLGTKYLTLLLASALTISAIAVSWFIVFAPFLHGAIDSALGLTGEASGPFTAVGSGLGAVVNTINGIPLLAYMYNLLAIDVIVGYLPLLVGVFAGVVTWQLYRWLFIEGARLLAMLVNILRR